MKNEIIADVYEALENVNLYRKLYLAVLKNTGDKKQAAEAVKLMAKLGMFCLIIMLTACKETVKPTIADKIANPIAAPSPVVSPIPSPVPSPSPSPVPSPSPSPSPSLCASDFLVGKWISESDGSYYQFNADCTVYSSICDYTLIYPQELDHTRISNTDPAWMSSIETISVFASLPKTTGPNCTQWATYLVNNSNQWQWCDFNNITQNKMNIICNDQNATGVYYDRQ